MLTGAGNAPERSTIARSRESSGLTSLVVIIALPSGIRDWMTGADFVQMFALSQAAPGPNVLIVSLVGWKAAGIAGAVVAMAAVHLGLLEHYF